MSKQQGSMDMTNETNRQKFIEAMERCNNWLAQANEASEQGKVEKAEKLYTKSQFWLDRANKLEFAA